jgi:two-component system chemotaxis response regulator CheB
MEALVTLARGLPRDLPAAVFVVWHLSPQSLGILPQELRKAGPLRAAHAIDGEAIRPGRIYVAPPNHHILLEPGRVRVTIGPRENGFRPAVDPLFRSSALAYGSRVVGVVLTGSLDDGTAGLWAIKVRGGIAVVQDPVDALYPSMPRSALHYVRVDYCSPLAQMPALLARLAREEAGPTKDSDMDDDICIETRIAMEDNAMASGVMKLGPLSPYTCPECHGTLVQLKSGGMTRFRCHTGHAYTLSSLLAEVTTAGENSLWNTLRALDEGAMLLEHMTRHLRDARQLEEATNFEAQADAIKRRANQIREILMPHKSSTTRRVEEQESHQCDSIGAKES